MDLLHLVLTKRRHRLINDHSFQLSQNTFNRHCKTSQQMDPLSIDIEFESPPLVFHGTPANSTGALLSGQVALSITKHEIQLRSLEMALLGKVTTSRPVSKDCLGCKVRVTAIKRWRFLPGPCLQTGKHHFPFSYHLQGCLPTTSHGSLGSIEYVLEVQASSDSGHDVNLSRPLKIGRALKPMGDRTISPHCTPLQVGSKLTIPSFIHPIGLFNVQLRLTDVCKKWGYHERRYHLLKVNWRIEEHSCNISPACFKHQIIVGGEERGIKHTDMRVIGSNDVTSGFKNDFETPGGQIEVEFQACVKPDGIHVCDVNSPTGFMVSHLLVLDLLLSEHLASTKEQGGYTTPTGNMNSMRMETKLILSERAGMGISWDEERPPLYDDVPSSPPGYFPLGGDISGGDSNTEVSGQ